MTEQVEVGNQQPVENSNEFEFGHGKFIAVRAKPSVESGLTPEDAARPVVYLPGHNLNRQTSIAKAGFDIQQVANASGSEVLSFVFLGDRSKDVSYTSGYPDGASIPQLYSDKAADILQALRKMGELDKGPLDLIGYSDGGPIAMTMVEHFPNGFRNVQLDNVVGLDNRSNLGHVMRIPLELGRVRSKKAVEFVRRLLSGEKVRKKDGKLEFSINAEQSSGKARGQRFAEQRAIARVRIDGLFANLLKRNPNLRFLIMGTENDAFAQAKRVQKTVGQSLGVGETRVTFGITGWDQHMISTRREKRGSRLGDMGKWMREMRQVQSR